MLVTKLTEEFLLTMSGRTMSTKGAIGGAHPGKGRQSKAYMTPAIILSHAIVGVVAFQFGYLAGYNERSVGFSQARLASAASFRRLDPVEYALNSSLASTPLKLGEDLNNFRKESYLGKQFPSSMRAVFSGAARVDREEFTALVDVGTPIRESSPGNTDLLLLYVSASSLPHHHGQRSRVVEHIPSLSAKEALQNCEVVKVVLINPVEKKQCIAISGEYESSAIYKFMRLPKDFVPTKKWGGPSISSPNDTLQLVGNTQRNNGNALVSPSRLCRDRYFQLLADYLVKLPSTVARLTPLAKKAAGRGKVVTVMVCNEGQSTLLFNFVCSTRAANIDTSTVLLFATDKPTAKLGRALGLNAFEVQDAFGTLPVKAARAYGDRAFVQMMLAKLYCVQLVNHVGYDVLFQDVDVVWRRNPLEYFEQDLGLKDYDILAQDDGSRAARFSPYAVNTGFYYVRHNQRTENFLSALVRSGDSVMEDGSHQSVFISLLREHASRHGLKVKVFDRDSEQGRLFPGGYHFHRRPDFMKSIMNGTNEPYAFHMSWTINHNMKRQFLQQSGYWFVHPGCLDESQQPMLHNSSGSDGVVASQPVDHGCCVVSPDPTCHYRDKPSRVPCAHSPTLDKGRPSFW